MKNENNEEVEGNEESIKPSEYVKELLKEKIQLNPEQHSNAMRLLDQGFYYYFVFLVVYKNIIILNSFNTELLYRLFY